MNKMYGKINELSRKWKELDKKSLLFTVGIVSMLLLSCFLFAVHLHNITINYRNVIDDKIAAKVESTGTQIISNTLFVADKVETAAKNLAMIDSGEFNKDNPDVLQIIREAYEETDIVGIVLTDVNGKVICGDSTVSIGDGFRMVINEYDGISDFYLADNDIDVITDNDSIVIISPVRHGNVINGYVIGVCEYSKIIVIDEIRDEVPHDEVIIDENSMVVALIRNNEIMKQTSRINFFDELAKNVSQADYEAYINAYEECMNGGASGSYVSTSGTETIRYIFQPMSNTNGWCIINCITKDSIAPIVKRMLVNSLIIFALIIAILITAGVATITHIRNEQKRVSDLAYLDGLTGVRNRTAFTERAEELLRENKDLPYYISCYDIVNFRIINETYGHERSDEVIKALASASSEAFGKNEVFGRINADVFVALVINDGEEEERASFIEEKVTKAARKVFINHPIRIKKGYFEVTNYMESVSRMIDKANIARKYAGQDAKIFTYKYSDDLMQEARKTEMIESQMNSALANHEFVPYLQAKYDMEKNSVCGAEALVRWKKADGSLVPPGDFIPLFEKNGFVEKIDFYILEEICKYIRTMIDEGRAVYPVSVNQSRYLLNDPDYVSRVRDILLKYDIPVGLIELELTETVFFHERDRMIDMMNDLKNIHVNLSIDDFGSGYSSFNLLKDVPFDVLKIDRGFLSDIEQSEKGKWILKEIVEMAHGLGMNVICEGVETREQIEMLLSINCKHAQGFYYARPIPLEEYIAKYNVVQGL